MLMWQEYFGSEWYGGADAVQANDSTAGHNAVRRTRDSVHGLAKLFRRLEIFNAVCRCPQVVMRNINLIAQRQPNILQTDVRMFVCKYNDPLYVKLEKIAVMVLSRACGLGLLRVDLGRYPLRCSWPPTGTLTPSSPSLSSMPRRCAMAMVCRCEVLVTGR